MYRSPSTAEEIDAYYTRHNRRTVTAPELSAYAFTLAHPEITSTRAYREAAGDYANDARQIRRGIDAAQADYRAAKQTEAVEQFTQGYVDAAIWLAQVSAPDGETVEAADAFGLGAETITADLAGRLTTNPHVVEECAAFVSENWADLLRVILEGDTPDWTYHGHDFYLTREGHGAGFWDRGYDAELADRLTDQAEGYGSAGVEVWEEESPNAPHPFHISHD